MEHLFDQEWEIMSAGGASGEAFFARYHEQKLFLKRNSSPFLAVLSAEGIVPRLKWTKRLENGDVITAQHWLNGRELKAQEMNGPRIAKMLKKIHSSKPLTSMLRRLGKEPYAPSLMLEEVVSTLDTELTFLKPVREALDFLNRHIDDLTTENFAVCHGDVNHNNWLLSEIDELFLIDWDGAMLADPAVDIGMLLYWYVPEAEWADWMADYGEELTGEFRLRMKWYVVCQALIMLQWQKDKGRLHDVTKWMNFLQRCFQTAWVHENKK
ncbi:phosphotransferase family protein [Jeotgalibacillus sp. R-1-5s-1]|uniref:phosphotransferase family protein n=1 Tax=Jeotgalibacillus sp. R-1-5s-1 TaxID=2555897 RepID=UPI00106BEA4A|nr:phosphotransferase family protein [Jeotgalibacillus sp. R-1-5s-1]TFD98179.1 phosphotransferase [Jeotgalibacillus sp. R-1-5s-1]